MDINEEYLIARAESAASGECAHCGANDPFMTEMKITLRGSEFHYRLCEPCTAAIMEGI